MSSPPTVSFGAVDNFTPTTVFIEYTLASASTPKVEVSYTAGRLVRVDKTRYIYFGSQIWWLSPDDTVLIIQAPSMGGMSGSPIYRMHGGQKVLIGIVSGGSFSGYTVGVRT